MPARRPRLSIAEVNYGPRNLGGLIIIALMASASSGWTSFPLWFWVVWALTVPHIEYFLASRARDVRRAERVNVLLDFVWQGIGIGMASFGLWPTTAIGVIVLINALMFGGPRFLFLGLAPLAAGVAIGSASNGFLVQWQSGAAATAASIAAIAFYVGYIALTAYRLRALQRATRAALEREEQKSNELLVNMLPVPVVGRLKAGEKPIADQFADVTVIFADLVDFTPLSERLGPKRTVLLLNELFRQFDQKARELGVEKIETTGDGYLAVGGAPQSLDDHPHAVARFGLAILEAVNAVRILEDPSLQVRVGIHTGPVFGGVIGESRFHYKIFGDTVNVASRVQSQSRPGNVLVSETTFKRLAGHFNLKEHGTVELKGHGPMRTYWLEP